MIADIYMNNLKDYKGAEITYREFIKNYPKVKMITSGILGLGLSLYEQQLYIDAREAVKDIDKKQQPGANPVIVIEGKYLAALCLAKANKWDQALGQFNFIQATFPGSDKAFESGLYIANYYKDRGETKLADNAFSNIEKYIIKYTNPETTNPMLAARAIGYLARCYTEEKNFPKAIETLATLHSKYPKTTDGQLAPLRLADLYENVLKDKAKAIEWLNLFITENPDAENIGELETHIKALSQ
jgi:TolA-binding protein